MTGRKGILTLFGVFVAPFLLAFVVLKMGWFNAGQTNKGEFMDIELTLQWLLPDDPSESEWIIFYHMPSDCSETCNNVLYSLNQGYQALGKLQGKAHPVVIRDSKNTLSEDSIKEQYGFVQVIAQNDKQTDALAQLTTDHVYLVDPLGRVVLRYAAKDKREEMIMVTKDWMSDLKRLLKYSRTS